MIDAITKSRTITALPCGKLYRYGPIKQSGTSKAVEIIRAAAKSNDVLVARLLSPERTHWIAHIRQAIMAKIREETDLSLPEIGRLFKRDHTTVLHALRADGGPTAVGLATLGALRRFAGVVG